MELRSPWRRCSRCLAVPPPVRVLRIALAAAALFWWQPPQPVRAQTEAPAIAALVPDEAAALLSFRLPEIEDGFAFADLLSGLYPELARLVAELRAPLALPSLSESALAAHGIRGDEASFASLGRRPAKLPKAAMGLAHRLVVPVADPTAFAAYAQGVLQRAGFAVFDLADKKARAPAWAKPLASTNKKNRVLLLGHAADTASGVAMRWQTGPTHPAGFAIFDVFVPASPPAKAKQVVPLFVSGMRATIEDNSFVPLRDRWTQGTRQRLAARASFVLVVQPEAMVNVLPAACQPGWRQLAGAYFNEAALTARLNPFDWKLRVAFVPTPSAASLLRQGGNDDGLIDARALAAAGLGAGILYAKSAADWAQFPRPAVLGRSWQEALQAFDDCGGGAVAIAFASFWPHLLTGLFNETLQPLGTPDWLKSARNLAMGVHTPFAAAGRPQAPAATWMASFESPLHKDLSQWLSRHSPDAPEKASFPGRSPTLWALATPTNESATGTEAKVDRPRAAGLEALPSGRCGLALSPIDGGLDWYYSLKRRPAVFGNRAALGSMHINVGRILNLAAEDSDPGTRDAVALATSQLAMLGGDLVVTDGVLELDLSFAGNGI